MAELLPWLLLILPILTVLIGLTEGLIGSDGAKAAKERLVKWYVYIGDHDWSAIISSSAKVTDEFVTRFLGERLISIRAFTRWSAITAPLSLLGLALSPREQYDLGISPYIFWVSYVWKTVFLVVLVNVVIDFLLLVANRLLLKRLAGAVGMQLAIFSLAYALVAIYIAAILVDYVDSIGSNFLTGQPLCLHAKSIRCLSLMAMQFFSHPILLRSDAAAVLGEVLPAMLSSLLFLGVTSASLVLFVTRNFTKPAVLLVIERMAGSPKSVFSTAAAVVTSIIAVATAMDHFLSHK
jgi:hypothetical protein